MSPAYRQARCREVEEFYDANHAELFCFLRKMGVDLVEAEDILNDCFLAIWQYWDALRGSNPRAYLYTVARNQIKKRWLKRARKPEDFMGDRPAVMAEGSAVITADFEQQVVDRQAMLESMRRALQKLTVRERAAVLLRYYVGCDVAETALIMGIKEGTVKRYASDGLHKLNRALTGRNPDDTREEGA
jgi:RNA polymerase sigma-70 factor, ECF subfamily